MEIIVESSGRVCTITINRPERMNALNLTTLEKMAGIVQELQDDSTIRVVVITGAGEKAFCAGADLKDRAGMTTDQVRRFIAKIRDTFTAIESLPQPVIAAINGFALGGGTELALVSDLRVASKHAILGLTEVKLAIIPAAGGTQRLPRLIGKGRAKELILTGRRIGASEALHFGLLNRVVPGDKLMATTMELAGQLLENGPLAMQQAKMAIDKGCETDLTTGLRLETEAYEKIIPTMDRVEGFTAFVQKRQPIYTGE
ncbi:MAG: enoyl-CoA hydratase-related protein [Syntrophobacteraceae bacterium]